MCRSRELPSVHLLVIGGSRAPGRGPLGLDLICAGDEAERPETLGAATRWLPDMVASTMGVERQSNKAPAPKRHESVTAERGANHGTRSDHRAPEGRK